MEWDIGYRGLATWFAYSLGFGLIVQLLWGRGVTNWMWLIAGSVYFVSGLLISEAWFGEYTEAELQPNIDGLSRDEAMLISLIPGLVAVFLTRYVVRHKKAGTSGPLAVPQG